MVRTKHVWPCAPQCEDDWCHPGALVMTQLTGIGNTHLHHRKLNIDVQMSQPRCNETGEVIQPWQGGNARAVQFPHWRQYFVDPDLERL